MIRHAAFGVEPWCLRETALDLDILAQTESVFALANGHIGLRGNLDEGEPAALPGTYLNAFYELRQLPYAEAGYGNPHAGQAVVNVTDGNPHRVTLYAVDWDSFGRAETIEVRDAVTNALLDTRSCLLAKYEAHDW